jgi:hypothetical protein
MTHYDTVSTWRSAADHGAHTEAIRPEIRCGENASRPTQTAARFQNISQKEQAVYAVLKLYKLAATLWRDTPHHFKHFLRVNEYSQFRKRRVYKTVSNISTIVERSLHSRYRSVSLERVPMTPRAWDEP